MPSVLPMARKSQANSVHLRLATIHSWSRRPVTSAATAKAKGIEHPTKPTYRLGGWMIM
jgi:hypothetical protein